MLWLFYLISCWFLIFQCGSSTVIKFPDGFRLGVATSSYQVEGAWNVSDKSANIWDEMTHNNLTSIKDKSNGDIGSDSYHLYTEDVKLLKKLNVDYYRFSISWSRLLPNGFPNKISEDGVRYYNNLINELLANGIEPVVTIYHWDLPLKLSKLGGWTNSLIVDWFEDYARVIFDHFGDRVKYFITINEPQQVCLLGYGDLIMNHAPNLNIPTYADYLCSKNVIMAHARAYRLYDQVYRKKYGGRIGITNFMFWLEPATDTKQDIEAAERAMAFLTGIFIEPIFSSEGGFPKVVVDAVAKRSAEQSYPRSRLPVYTEEEKKFVKGTSDFYGLNYYTIKLVSHRDYKPDDGDDILKDANMELTIDPQWKTLHSHWFQVAPDIKSFRKLLNYVKDRYNSPEIIVTENGYSSGTGLEDYGRIEYMKEHLKQLLDAVYEDGVNITHYTAWTLCDNFEWTDGFTSRFGLCEIDYDNGDMTRRERLSAKFYAHIAATKELDLSFTPTFKSNEKGEL